MAHARAEPQRTHERSRRTGGGDVTEGAFQANLRARQEALLDEAVEETFPASDPIAVMRLL